MLPFYGGLDMVSNNCQDKKCIGQSVNHKTYNSDCFFENLVWLTTKEAARYLRKSANAVRILVHRGFLKARKFRRRLYFRKDELCALIETSNFKEVYNGSK